MKQLKAISYPRSGVSIFCKILIEYYAEKLKENKVYFCNTVACCGHKQPCRKSESMDLDLVYMKNHDFGSKIKNVVDPDIIHVVLYRRKALDQMNAYFRYSMGGKKTMEPQNRNDDYQTTGDNGRFMNQLNRKTNFASYRAFTNKWIHTNKNPNTYFLEYDEYMKAPLKHMANIIKCVDGSVDEERLQTILTAFDVRKHFDVEKSVYYIADFNERFGIANTDFDPGDRFLNSD
jgi:hypothetical protein